MKKKELIELLCIIGNDDSEVYWHSEGTYGTISCVSLQKPAVLSKDKATVIIINVDND